MRWSAAMVLGLLLFAAAAPRPGQAAEPVSRIFAAPFDQVWSATEAALESLGWDIDERERAGGLILTDSEGVAFKDFGVYGEGTRHRLRVQLKAVGEGRTSVAVTRELYKEERILWTRSRTPLETTDTTVETALLRALEQSLPVIAAPAPEPPAGSAAPPRPPTPAAAPGPRSAPPATEGRTVRGEFTYRVTYLVKGTAPGALLTYRNPRGSTEQTSVRLPWEISFDARGGDFLYISAQNESDKGSVTCEILLDGVSRTNATSTGAYVIAECTSAASR